MRTEKNNDQILKTVILDRLNWDFRVSKSDIKLFVKSGIVSVYGYFDKDFRRKAALDAIKSTQGVLATVDRTQVLTDYHRTDQELEVILQKRLLDQNLEQNEWVDLSVRCGVVTWVGRVKKERLKAWISKITWELSGVKDCFNLIKLGVTTPIKTQAVALSNRQRTQNQLVS